MKLSFLTAVSAAILAFGAASGAMAQAAPPTLTANVPGVCVFSQNALFSESTVGKAMVARLEQLKSQVQAELAADQTSFQTDYNTFQQKAATLPEQQAQQQQQQLKQRYDALQQKVDQRSREMQATQQVQMGKIGVAARPLFADVVKQRNCAVVLDGQAVMATNPSMDLTDQVITALNGKMTQIQFDREHLDPQAGQQR
jgi:outer membrane protein